MQAYVCLKCAEEFRSYLEWQQHMMEHHEKERLADES